LWTVAPVTATTEVARSAQNVFDYATDPSHFHEWQKGVVEGHVDALPGEAKVGDHCVTVRRIGFANRPTTAEITQLDPPNRWSVRGIDGPIRAHVDLTVEALAEQRSRLAITVNFEGHGIGSLLVPLAVARQARREMPANIEQLRRCLEASN
jgi:uncharacterized protein YndB with AHSA1/START domain